MNTSPHIIVVGDHGLHRNVLYRLTLYQVFTAMMFGAALIANAATNSIVLAGISYYMAWVKVMATMWLTVHLFAFVVCHKNFKKLEPLYVASSLIIPVPFGVVPSVLLSPNNVTDAKFHHVMEVIYSPGVALVLLSS